MNLTESNTAFELKAEVPGFNEKEIEIGVEPRRVTIAGKRETKKEEKKGKIVCSEICSDPILHVIDLPAGSRLVILYDINVTKASFPAAKDEEATYGARATKALSQWNLTIALDRLLADLAIVQSEGKTIEALGSSPPKIYVRGNPAVLILIDRGPVLQKLGDRDLMRVVNSPATVILEPDSGGYFLEGDGYWMKASGLNKP